jgi:hypothetical protein
VALLPNTFSPNLEGSGVDPLCPATCTINRAFASRHCQDSLPTVGKRQDICSEKPQRETKSPVSLRHVPSVAYRPSPTSNGTQVGGRSSNTSADEPSQLSTSTG